MHRLRHPIRATREPSGATNRKRALTGSVVALVAFAALMLSASQAFAYVNVYGGHLKLNVTGTGSGEVTSLGPGSGELALSGSPAMACSYNGTAASGVCENEPEETEEGEELFGEILTAAPAPGSQVVWTVQKAGFKSCPASNPLRCTVSSAEPAPGEDEFEVTAEFVAIPFHLSVYVNGGGTVTSTPAGISCAGGEECDAPFSGGATLEGHPSSGYALAGWIGCKQTGPTTCVAAPKAEGEEREVTAVFFKEGAKGQNGAAGPAGADGAQGPAGATGPAGAAGSAGPKGDTGAAGPQGPAGKDGKVTCKVQQKKGKSKVTCTVKYSGGASASRVHWRLGHAGHLVRGGRTDGRHLRLGHLAPGHYSLHIEGQKGSVPVLVG